MTAEVAVLNKDAVALAADSTVTVSGKKAYHTTNKLFALSSHHPIGIMVFGSGELGGIPWEVLIKLFRQKIGNKKYDGVSDYPKKFISFLEREIVDFNKEIQDDTFLEYAEDFLEVLADKIDSKVESHIKSAGDISKQNISSIRRKIVNDYDEYYKSEKKLPCLNSKTRAQITKVYRQNIYELVEEKLENHRFSNEYKNKILRICVNLFATKHTDVSGVVFAGFGEKELFPKIVVCDIECIIEGKIKCVSRNKAIENTELGSSRIMPFAQTESVSSFVSGMSDKMFGSVLDVLQSALSDFEKNCSELFASEVHSKSKTSKLEKKLAEIKAIVSKRFEDTIDRHRQLNYINPVMEAVQYLPKIEMAEVAESLVSITSIRQKFTLERESVGGAIDVAVISKCDGFVWIKRKHYFDPILNPMFMTRYNDTGDEA